MTTADLVLVATFVVVYGLVSRRVEHSPATGPMIFVAFGLLIGSAGFDAVDFDLDSAGVGVLAEATLGLLLFTDATRIDVTRLRSDFALPARMLGIGLPLAIGCGTVLAMAIFDIPFATAALLAAILAPTDAALGEAVVSSPVVPVRVRQTLNVESGLNDGIALPAVTIFLALVLQDDEFASAGSWIRFAAEQIGIGAIVGATVGLCGGVLVRSASQRGWMAGVYRQLAVLGIAVAAFSAAVELGGNGFISTFIAGLAFGSAARDVCARAADFTDDLAHLLAMISFIVFGATVVGPSLDALDWRIVLYAVGSLAIVRPVAIAVSLIGAQLKLPTIGFLGWFGPRGLASILFGIIASEEAHPMPLDPLVFIVVSWTVLFSIVLHGVSAGPTAAAYGRWWDSQREKGTSATMVEAEATTVSRRRGPHPGSSQ